MKDEAGRTRNAGHGAAGPRSQGLPTVWASCTIHSMLDPISLGWLAVACGGAFKAAKGLLGDLTGDKAAWDVKGYCRACGHNRIRPGRDPGRICNHFYYCPKCGSHNVCE